MPVIDLANVVYRWGSGKPVLDIPELVVHRTRKVFIHGPSGSGKTTLLGLLACLALTSPRFPQFSVIIFVRAI